MRLQDGDRLVLEYGGRAGCTQAHLDDFASELWASGFTPLTTIQHTVSVCHFGRWLLGLGLDFGTLRHTCAMHTLRATHDIRKVALWLGHASVQTTEIYLRADPQEKLEAIEAVVPPALRRGRFRAPDQLLAMLRSKTLSARVPLVAAAERADSGPPTTAALDTGRRSRYSNGRLRT